MLNGLKKLFIGFLTLAVVLAIGNPQTVKAEQMKTVYVEVPSDWENPCLWAWDDDGVNVFAAWPGGAFEADANNEGWYYTWIPEWANHVIVNANEGSIQTSEILVDAKDMWITVADAENAEVYYEQKTSGDIPEYVEKFVVHASVSSSWSAPSLWAWSAPDGTNAFAAWPGEQMTLSDSGWYDISVPVWVNSIIVNANEGTVQTADISIDPAEIWVTVEEDGTYEISYNDPDAVDVPNINVFVKAPADWENPCLWAWSAPDGTNVFAAWPGEPLESSEDGWLVKSIPGWVNSIIVNGNDGTVQTTDMSIDPGKDVWVIVNGPEDYEVSYELPVIESAQEPETQEGIDETATETEPETQTEAVAVSTDENKVPVGPIVVGIAVAAVAIGGGAYVVKQKKSK